MQSAVATNSSSAELHLAHLLSGGVTSAEILARAYPEPKWIVPDLLPEGLGLVAGKPKVGKSWLALNLAIAVSLGGRVLGQIAVERREVLYLALEDTERRLRRRLDLLQALGTEKLYFYTSWRKGEAGLADLRLWLASHPQCGLVIIDTLGRLREPSGDMSYLEDVDYVSRLKAVADGRSLTILAVHHCRKADAEDFLDLVSGTSGIAGSADTVWVLQRSRGTMDAVLSVTGRDIEEQELALRYETEIGWSLMGDAKEMKLSQERQEVIKVLRETGEPMSPRDVSAALGKKYEAVKMTLWRMSKNNEIGCLGGKYHAP